MKISILIVSAFLFLIGCATYNTPFINADETTKLSFGMTQKEVLETVGEPLYVASGGDNKVTYVYEVRTILVKSKAETGEPNKFNSDQKHDSPHHKLQIIFKDGRVLS